jgi:hypothetical protein
MRVFAVFAASLLFLLAGFSEPVSASHQPHSVFDAAENLAPHIPDFRATPDGLKPPPLFVFGGAVTEELREAAPESETAHAPEHLLSPRALRFLKLETCCQFHSYAKLPVYLRLKKLLIRF